MRFTIALEGTPGYIDDDVLGEIDQLDRETFEVVRPHPKRDGYWWVARDEAGRAVGFAGLDLLGPKTGYFSRVGVAKRARGYKLQVRFLRAIIKKARQIGLTKIVSYTYRFNHHSANNMIRCGFKLYEPPQRYQFGSRQSIYLKLDL